MKESRKRANEKWLAANYEQISFRAPKGTRAQIKQWAEECGRPTFSRRVKRNQKKYLKCLAASNGRFFF